MSNVLNSPITEITVTMNVNWEQLREQKDALLSVICENNGDEVLEGLLDTIDHIQDTFYAELVERCGKEAADAYAERFMYLATESEDGDYDDED